VFVVVGVVGVRMFPWRLWLMWRMLPPEVRGRNRGGSVRAHNLTTRIAVAAIVAALSVGPVAAAADDEHTVSPGETLSGIAARNHTTVRALAEANGLNDANRIIVGQVLVIPAGASAAPATVVHVVAPGETLGRIAGRYGTTARAIADANGIRNINVVVIGSRLTIPTGSTAAPAAPSTVHTVARNETLGGIAGRYGVTVGAIVAANGLANANLIRIGAQLTIPAASGSGGGGGGGTSAYGVIGSDGRTGLAGTYVVKPGDSLGAIARQLGVPAVGLAAANGILPPFSLYAHAQLVLSTPNRLPTNLAACPVPGSSSVNDWGFPRSGGRAHEGTDLFAPRGTPVLAPVAGIVSHATGVVGGNQFRLRGEDGTTYLGSHMDAFGASGRVNAGDVVGYVGDSGNARGGRPHLHFEVHPDNGPAMNPYPVVNAAC
jgi:LysM repeat protein